MMKPARTEDRADSRVTRNLLTRLITLPLTVTATFLSLSMTVDSVGSTLYGQVALIATMSALLPFADLGLGAAVVNAVSSAQDIEHDEDVRRTILGSLRLLTVSGGFIILVSGLIAGFGLWTTILGVPTAEDGFEIAVFSVLTLFAVGLPLGLGVRILQGSGRNDIATLLVCSAPLISLVFVFLFRWGHASFVWFALAPGLGMTLAALASVSVVHRVCGLRLFRLARDLVAFKLHPGTKVSHVAGPMLVIMIGLPIAMQTDRLVLSHVSSAEQLTQYSVAAQLYASMWGVIVTGGQSLWSTFAYRRSVGLPVRMLWTRSLASLSLLSLLMAICLVVLGGWVTSLVTQGSVNIGRPTFAVFGALLVVQALHLPSGMFLTTSSGLRFQAKCVVVMVGVNLPASMFLSTKMGASGPVLASLLTIFIIQAVPSAVRVWRTSTPAEPGSERVPQPEHVQTGS